MVENAFGSLDHGLRGEVLHAGMRMRAPCQPAQIARRAGQSGANHGILAMVGTGPHRVARSEKSDGRAAKRDRKVQRAGIVGDAVGGAADQRRKLAQRCLAGEVDDARSKARDVGADGTLAGHADQDRGIAALQEVPRHLG